MKKTLGSAGVPAWMVTFADLMALMMTFFVLLYSFSNTDEGKYKAVVESMARGFSAQWIEWPGANQGETGPKPGVFQLPAILTPGLDKSGGSPKGDAASEAKYQAEFEKVSTALVDDIKAGTLTVESQGNQISVRFPEKATFPAGSEILNKEIAPTLGRIAHLIEDIEGEIVVSGYTDDRPIQTARFRSNWELSASRAVSVVHALLQYGHPLAEEHITVVGHAAKDPLVPNDSEENRAKNRRVEISIILPENDKPTEPESP